MDSHRSRFTFLLVLLLIFIFVPASHAYTRTVEGFVQKVSDGDTVTLITRDGTKLRVRLYGIDAPEVRHEKKPAQPFGEEAKRALAGKVFRKEVTLTIQDRDQYGGDHQDWQSKHQRGDGAGRMGLGVQGISAWPVCQRVHQRGEGSKGEEAWVIAAV